MNNTNLITAVLSVCSSVITILIYYVFLHIICSSKEKYVPVKKSISFNGIINIDFSTLTRIRLNYSELYIRLTDINRNECEIHFYNTKRCRRTMMKMGSTILECYKAYCDKDKIPCVNNKIYTRKIYNNKAFVIVNKTKACIEENTEIK